MSLNESIVEDAALEWFGELGSKRVKSEIMEFISYFTFHSPIRHLPSIHPSLFFAPLRDALLPKLLSEELSIN